MNTATFTNRSAWKWGALAVFAAICAWLLQRSLGLHPTVFADEWYYSKMSRLQELKEAIVPSYLYLWIFRATNACGTAFYDCAHVANVLLFAAAAPFVYLVARQVAGKPVAAFLALLSMAAPINVYTAYFMPEAPYYFGFWVLSWVALTRRHWHWAAYGAAIGLVLGLLSLVKVHALFLVPALCLFLPYARWSAGGRWVATGSGTLAVALACIAAVKYGLGYLLAGDVALNLFGNFYQGAANAAGSQRLLRLIGPAYINASGHLMGLVLLLPLPLALLAQSVLRPPAREQADTGTLLQAYALLMLGATAGVTVLFSASLAANGILNEDLRLHLRYYDFVLPLLWLVGAAALGKPATRVRPALRWTIAIVLIAVLGFALVKLPAYALHPVDGPELIGVSPATLPGQILLGIDLAVLLLWALGQRLAAPLFLFAALPLSVASGTAFTNRVVSDMRIETPAERAAAAVLRHVPAGERGQIVLTGSDVQQLMRTQFRIDDKDTSIAVLDGKPVLDQYQIPVREKWLLVLGKYQLPAGLKLVVRNDEFSLASISVKHRPLARASLARPIGQGLIAGAEGLSQAEQWGRWSDTKRVVLHLNQPLPEHARIVLKAQAYGVNAELPFTMHVGGQSAPFRLGWLPQEVGLAFDTDGTQRDVVIDVPQPDKPSSHGAADTRALGIGICDIEIGVIDQASLAGK
jgi:hypothetical protein